MHDAEEVPAPDLRAAPAPVQWFSAPPGAPADWGIPRQRGSFGPPPPLPPPPPPPPRRRSGPALMIGAAVALVAALAVGAGVVYVERSPLSLAEQAAAAEPGTAAEQAPQSPAEKAKAALKAQAAALLAGDEQGWLAAVDPARSKLRTRYRAMFRTLRGLGISHFDYRASVDPDDKTGTLRVRAEIAYCFTTDRCPKQKDNESDGPPTITQRLTVKEAGGRMLITELTTAADRKQQQPTPWETGDLAVRSGERVVVAGARSEQRYFKQVLAAAEKAARVNDRFAALVGNPQVKYRVYVAGPKQWKTWYGGITDKWVIGYAMPLSDSGSDVVLNISAVRADSKVLATTLQHELAHVVTLGGAYRTGGRSDMWLEEGIAEYIGWYPRSATASWRRDAVRSLVNGDKPPKSIAARAPSADAGPETSDAFYGLGHFAADCMARKYGQSALFVFARLYLRENRDLEPASQEAFGRPFKTVDRTCLAWIRDTV